MAFPFAPGNRPLPKRVIVRILIIKLIGRGIMTKPAIDVYLTVILHSTAAFTSDLR